MELMGLGRAGRLAPMRTPYSVAALATTPAPGRCHGSTTDHPVLASDVSLPGATTSPRIDVLMVAPVTCTVSWLVPECSHGFMSNRFDACVDCGRANAGVELA